jgi:hypothetical protein
MQTSNQYTFYQRITQMFIGWGTVGLVYFSLGWRETEAIILPELWLDKQLPFTPTAIWLYLAFFILIPYTYVTTPAERLFRLRYAMQISAIISGIIFLALPSQLSYPDIAGQGASVEMLRFLIANDSPKNCLPSLHAALSLICVITLWSKQKVIKSILITVAGLAIGISIIQLRRHLTIDLSAGLMVGLFSYYMAKPLENVYQSAKRTFL